MKEIKSGFNPGRWVALLLLIAITVSMLVPLNSMESNAAATEWQYDPSSGELYYETVVKAATSGVRFRTWGVACD